jgi:hypothetical protein
MREFLTKEGSGRSVRFFDFSEQSLSPLEIPGVEHLPCLAVEGRVVAMSLPNPPKAFETSEEQIGACRGTWGKLLPGWHLGRTADGEVKLHGPAVPVGGLTMPRGSVVDEHGFFTVMGSDGAGN